LQEVKLKIIFILFKMQTQEFYLEFKPFLKKLMNSLNWLYEHTLNYPLVEDESQFERSIKIRRRIKENQRDFLEITRR